MATELVINASLPETRIVLLEEGKIQELLVERESERGIVGNIYKGRVTRVLPGMQAAFVDIGLEKAAFLYVDDVYSHSEILTRGFGDSDEGDDEDDGDDQGPDEGAELSADLNGEAEAEGSSAIDRDSEQDTAGNREESSNNDGVESDGPDSDDEVPTEMGEDPDAPADNEPSDNGSPQDVPAGALTGPSESTEAAAAPAQEQPRAKIMIKAQPEKFIKETSDAGDVESDRTDLMRSEDPQSAGAESPRRSMNRQKRGPRSEFKERRGRDRRIRSSNTLHPRREQVNIQDLLKEGQEVIVQVAKDPIAAKGARLTCHVSLAGRHLVCMPTVDHVGVSRRIDNDQERRQLKEFVYKNRTEKMGFIVRTASSMADAEMWIKADMDYLAGLWTEIQSKAAGLPTPSLVYEDLNSVVRAMRDWVSEDVDKIIIDSRDYFDQVKDFVAQFMPALMERVELYQGDIPVFDAYGISQELHRALERRVWLKSGGYIVVDQAEALVAIDVNTGRHVGQRNLEDTILKVNLEAVEEIAYQLRIRNCGGIIIIDLIDMEREENKRRVYRALEMALRRDRARPTIIKISELGLIEMTRKRTRDTIIRVLCQSCTHCEGRGYVKSKKTVAYEVLREIERDGFDPQIRKLLVQAHPDVVDHLAIEERSTLDLLERKFHKQIFLQSIRDFHMEQYEVISDRTGRPIVGRLTPQESRTERPDRTEGRSAEGSGHRDRGGQKRDGRRGGGRDRDANRENNRENNRGRNRTEREPAVDPAGAAAGATPDKPRVTIQIRPAAHPVPVAAPSETPQDLDDSYGNRVTDSPQPVVMAPRLPLDDDMSEEDRLAYLRAQATQDAALAAAQQRDAGAPGSMQKPRYNGPRNGGHGGGAGSRGRRGRGGGGRGGGRGGPRGSASPNYQGPDNG